MSPSNDRSSLSIMKVLSVEVSRLDVAALFCQMTVEEQADFFRHVAHVIDIQGTGALSPHWPAVHQALFTDMTLASAVKVRAMLWTILHGEKVTT